MYNIPASERGLDENIAKRDTLPNGTRQGTNSFQQMGYGGPCPPLGNAHRYYFKLYALDTQINIPGEATRDQVVSAMQGHIIAEGEIVGTYQRK
jgi:Raf kinase inhibitor-like YbhB/YbcL family protein